MDTSHTYRTQAQACPCCMAILDAVTVVPGEEEGPPEPGSLTICAYCAAALEIKTPWLIVPLSRATLASLSPQERKMVKRGQAAVKLLISQRGNHL